MPVELSAIFERTQRFGDLRQAADDRRDTQVDAIARLDCRADTSTKAVEGCIRAMLFLASNLSRMCAARQHTQRVAGADVHARAKVN